MQDEVRDRSVSFVIKVGKSGAKLTAALLKLAMRKYLNRNQQPVKHGKQSLRQLASRGDGLKTIEITDANIKSFNQIAKKYKIDFTIKKDVSNGRYLVFFQPRQADALDAAFREFTAKTLNQQNQKKSVRQKLTHFKSLANTVTPNKEKYHQKEAR